MESLILSVEDESSTSDRWCLLDLQNLWKRLDCSVSLSEYLTNLQQLSGDEIRQLAVSYLMSALAKISSTPPGRLSVRPLAIVSHEQDKRPAAGVSNLGLSRTKSSGIPQGKQLSVVTGENTRPKVSQNLQHYKVLFPTKMPNTERVTLALVNGKPTRILVGVTGTDNAGQASDVMVKGGQSSCHSQPTPTNIVRSQSSTCPISSVKPFSDRGYVTVSKGPEIHPPKSLPKPPGLSPSVTTEDLSLIKSGSFLSSGSGSRTFTNGVQTGLDLGENQHLSVKSETSEMPIPISLILNKSDKKVANYVETNDREHKTCVNTDCAATNKPSGTELSLKWPSAGSSSVSPELVQQRKSSAEEVEQAYLTLRSLVFSPKSSKHGTDGKTTESCPQISAGGSAAGVTLGQGSGLLSGEPPTTTTTDMDVKPVSLVVPVSEESNTCRAKTLTGMLCPSPRNGLLILPPASIFPAVQPSARDKNTGVVITKGNPVQKRRLDVAKENPRCRSWYCGQHFDSSRLLFSHIKRVHLKKRMRVCCVVCKEVIKTPTSFQRHYMKHGKFAPLGCFYCPRRFRKEGPLEQHTRGHERYPKNPAKCGWCNKESFNLAGLKVHIANVHTDRRQSVCKTCGKLVMDMKAHMKRHKRQKLPCELCGREFSAQKFLDNHLRKHAKKKKLAELKELKKLKRKEQAISFRLCQVCGLTVKGLKSHMIKHTEDKPFGCEACGKKFATKSRLNLHKTTHTEEKKSLCTLCGNHYRSLKRHMAVHTGVKPYHCEICGFRFSFRSLLTRHMASHSSEKRFPCDKCDEAFGDKFTLSRHKLHLHGEAITCFFCGQKFLDKKSLKEHREEHKKFKCHLCEKKFSADKWLKFHVQKHAGIEAPFGCEACGKTFYVENNLIRHRLLHK